VRVGLLWRSEWDPAHDAESSKLHGVFAAFAALGVPAEPVVYSDERVDEVRAHLLGLDGVLVWVNPIEQGRDRSLLDPLLRDVADEGVWVSAHPEVIRRIATKQVLVDTRHLSWGTDTRLYPTAAELREELPARVAEAPRVLKQSRGMGGDGVWKVEQDGSSFRVQHAKGNDVASLSLGELVRSFEPYFAAGPVVEQPFQERIAEGMIRAYLTHAEVVGFTHQYPRGLMPPGPDDRPATKVFEQASAPAYAELRRRLESEWVPQLQEIAGVATEALPVIWDIDFLFGPGDTYVLCEINASSTFAFPEHAMPTVARAAVRAIA
jgi:hypothetical protein